MLELPTGKMPRADEVPVATYVRHCCSHLSKRLEDVGIASGLLVGCGDGNEVVYMRRFFSNRTVLGLDIEGEFSSAARVERCVLTADAEKLPFRSGAFHFAAALHSLEHVRNAGLALDELRRVLREGGWLYVAAPNKSRVVGYLGSCGDTAWQKIKWNLKDWRDRLRGRFENELGAHAGFERTELLDLLAKRFANVHLLTEDFIRFKYGGRLPNALIDFLLAPGIVDYMASAHYALCQSR